MTESKLNPDWRSEHAVLLRRFRDLPDGYELKGVRERIDAILDRLELRAPKDDLASAKAEPTPDELVKLSAIERLFEWAREHEEAAIPMPVFHRYMSKVDGGECPQWRIQLGVKVAAFSDPWSAVCAAADVADALARATGGDR